MTHWLFGIRINDLPRSEIQKIFQKWLKENVGRVIVTPNAEFILEARRNIEFKRLLNQSDLAPADSVGIQYALAALSSEPLRYRIPGVDLLQILCEVASTQEARILFFGGNTGSAASAAKKLKEKIPALDISTHDPGQITWDGSHLTIDEQTIEHIRLSRPAIVAVGLGQHKQEQCMAELKKRCPMVKIWIGVGGAFEMISCQKRRAPKFLRTHGFEWLWRLIIEPKRWRRILNASAVFPLVVLREAIRRGTFLRSTRGVFYEMMRE